MTFRTRYPAIQRDAQQGTNRDDSSGVSPAQPSQLALQGFDLVLNLFGLLQKAGHHITLGKHHKLSTPPP